MMSIDDQQIRAIAFLAARCRPTGSKPWDEAGIAANLRKIAHVDSAEVIIATIRAATNRKADTPGVIPNMTGEHWRERVTERQPARPPRREDECKTHAGQWADSCGGCRVGDLPGYGDDEPDPHPFSHADAAFDASLARAQLALVRGSLCQCGVRRETCQVHKAEDEEAR